MLPDTEELSGRGAAYAAAIGIYIYDVFENMQRNQFYQIKQMLQ